MVSAHLHVSALTAARYRAFRGDLPVAKQYFIGLSVVGAALAIYHYQLEHVPNEPTVCGNAVPCNVAVINIFGVISVPFLSMAAFLLITTLLLMARSHGDDYDDDEPIDPIQSTLDEQPDRDAVPAPA